MLQCEILFKSIQTQLEPNTQHATYVLLTLPNLSPTSHPHFYGHVRPSTFFMTGANLVHHSNSVSTVVHLFLPCQVERLQSQGLTLLSLALEHFPSFQISTHYVDHLVLGSAFIPQVPFSLLASSRYLSHPISSHLSNELLTIIPDFNSQPALKPFNTPAVTKSRIRRWGRRFG